MAGPWRALALAALLGAALSSCGSSGSEDDASNGSNRTPGAYCHAFYSRAAPLHDEFAAGSKDAVAGLLGAITAPGRLAIVFADMARHAPDDIATDTEAVRDAFQKVQDSAGDSSSNPVAAIVKGTLAGAAASDSLHRVGRYLQAHCPLDSAIARKYVRPGPPAGATTPTAAAPTDEAPAVGTQLAAPTGDGAFTVVTNIPGEGFSIVRDLVDFSTDEDSSTVTTYDASGAQLAEIPAGSFVGECHAADIVRADGRRIILTIASSTTPAQGIKAETSTSEIDAWDARRGAKLWSSSLGDQATQCDPANESGDGLIRFAATPDGRWGIFGEDFSPVIVDLATGKTHTSQLNLHVAGNVLAVPADYTPLNSSAFDPGTLAKAGTFRGFQFNGHPDIAPTGLLDEDGSGSPPAGSSEDGSIVFGLKPPGDDSSESDRIVAYSLPSMKVAWSVPTDSPYLIGEAGGVLLLNVGDPNPKLVALEVNTGRRLWAVPAGEVCGFTRSQLLLGINAQLATLDMKNGKQLSYTTDGDTCPDIRPGGIGIGTGSIEPGEEHGVTVTQVLKP